MRHNATDRSTTTPSSTTSASHVSRSSVSGPRINDPDSFDAAAKSVASARSSSTPASARLATAALTGLVAGTCLTIAVYASVWLVPPYLALLAFILGVPAGLRLRARAVVASVAGWGSGSAGRRGGPGRWTRSDGAIHSRRLGRGLHVVANEPGAPGGASAAAATTDDHDPDRLSLGASEAAQAVEEASSESTEGAPAPPPDGDGAAKPRRGRGRARKAKSGAASAAPTEEPTAVTWVRVGPGKFVRADAAGAPPASSEPDARSPASSPADFLAEPVWPTPDDAPGTDDAEAEPAADPAGDPASVSDIVDDVDDQRPARDGDSEEDGGSRNDGDPDDDPLADSGRELDPPVATDAASRAAHSGGSEPGFDSVGSAEPAMEDQGSAPEAFAALDDDRPLDPAQEPPSWTAPAAEPVVAAPVDLAPEPAPALIEVVVAEPTDDLSADSDVAHAAGPRHCGGLALRRFRAGRRGGSTRTDRPALVSRWRSARGGRGRATRIAPALRRPAPSRRNPRRSGRFHHAHRTKPPRSPPVAGP